MNRSNELETTRFALREIGAADLETLHSYWSDDVVTKYMNVSFKNIEETKQMVDLLNSLPERGEGRRWAIVDKKVELFRAAVVTITLKQSTGALKLAMNWAGDIGDRVPYRK
jgi:Acetyltransferases, including N-acetylases of ribosomal proteins